MASSRAWPAHINATGLHLTRYFHDNQCQSEVRYVRCRSEGEEAGICQIKHAQHLLELGGQRALPDALHRVVDVERREVGGRRARLLHAAHHGAPGTMLHLGRLVAQEQHILAPAKATRLLAPCLTNRSECRQEMLEKD